MVTISAIAHVATRSWPIALLKSEECLPGEKCARTFRSGLRDEDVEWWLELPFCQRSQHTVRVRFNQQEMRLIDRVKNEC